MLRALAFRAALLLFGSGFCALVYQVAWLRMLRLIFGASTAASAAVLAIFMGGLGLGGLLLGRRADRSSQPHRLYGGLELGVAAAAAASPWLLSLVRWAYVSLGGTAALGDLAGTGLRLALATLVLGVPTFLMGGTLPALARAVEEGRDSGRRSVALLYGTNTLGAVTGALFTTFVALELFGVRNSIWAAAVINLGVAWAAFRLKTGSATALEDPQGPAPAATPAATPRPSTQLLRRAPFGLVLGSAALVGFAFLLMELVWYRMLAPILGGSSYTFGLILAVALLGIGAGGLLYSAGAEGRRPTLAAFATTCSLEALLLAAPYALGDHLATLALLLRPLGDASFGLLVATWGVVTAVVVLPAALVAGYQFPLLVAILGAGRENVGREVGLTYAWNTLGAIVGSIAGGFGLLPLLTAPGVWRAVAGLLVALAAAATFTGWRSRSALSGGGSVLRHLLAPLTLGLVALVLVSATGPTAFWRHSPIGAGRLPSRFSGPNELRNLQHERRRAVTWEAEGVESNVALETQLQDMFLINGKIDGSALRDAPNMVMSVMIGALLHPQPKRALVIGLGTGTSAGWLAQVPSIEKVDVVELEPSVAHVAEVTRAVSFDVLHHPKVSVIYGDGRELLLTGTETYDLIFSQPSNPYRAGIASLFSLEFYHAAARRLNEGGILLQWLQGYEVDAHVVRMAYATVGEVFPEIETWQVHERDLLLAARREPWVHDLSTVGSRLGEEPFESALARTWGVEGIDGLYAGYLGSAALAAQLRRLHAGGLNTDDRPRMEFGFVRNLGRAGLFSLEDLRSLAERLGAHRPTVTGGEIDWPRARELRTASQVVWGGNLPAGTELGAEERYRLEARRAYRRNDLLTALRYWSAQPQPPTTPVDRMLVAEGLAEAGNPLAGRLAEEMQPGQPLDALLLEARLALRRGDVPGAGDLFHQAFSFARKDPWPFLPTLARALTLVPEMGSRDGTVGRRLFEVLSQPFAVHMLEELRWKMRLELARVLADPALCVEALRDFEPHVPWERPFLSQRQECYRQAGDPRAGAASDDLERFLADEPPDLAAGLGAAP